MKTTWSRRAIQHLVALRDYIAADSPNSAELVAERILESVKLLATQPHIGRPGRILGTRELVVPGTPYVIPYRVQGEVLELIAVLHFTSRTAALAREVCVIVGSRSSLRHCPKIKVQSEA